MIYDIIFPESFFVPEKEENEFYIRWFDRAGKEQSFMFTNWEVKGKVSTEIINDNDKDKLQSIIKDEVEDYNLIAENLTLNEVEVLRSLKVSKLVLRQFKSGEVERFAIKGSSFRYLQNGNRYNLTFSVRKVKNPLMT